MILDQLTTALAGLTIWPDTGVTRYALGLVLQAAFAGQKTVDAALDTATTQAAEAMKQYQAQVGK